MGCSALSKPAAPGGWHEPTGIPTDISAVSFASPKSMLALTSARTNPHTAWLKEHMTPGKLEDHYETRKLLGQGAYATVWSATHKKTRERFAVKCIDFKGVKKDKLDKTLAQIAQETQIHMKLRHKSVMRLEEFFLTKTKLFLVMELMRGGSLLDLILERGGLNEAEAQIAFREVFEGLKHMHEQHIIHRDIKLENIMLGEVNDLQSIKIADFGFAIVIHNEEERSKVTSLAGTPVYLAPEAVDSMVGHRETFTVMTPALDMWAGGVALFMLVGGFPPFEGKTSKEIFRAIYKCNVGFQAPAWRNVSDECISMITGLLTRDPETRYSAREALAHKWMRATITREDLSLSLLPVGTEGAKPASETKNLEKINSNQLDDSVYIKKSALLEIQQRHEHTLGRGMDNSLMRIFSKNKAKVKPASQRRRTTATNLVRVKSSGRAQSIPEESPLHRQQSLMKMLSIAGPGRFGGSDGDPEEVLNLEDDTETIHSTSRHCTAHSESCVQGEAAGLYGAAAAFAPRGGGASARQHKPATQSSAAATMVHLSASDDSQCTSQRGGSINPQNGRDGDWAPLPVGAVPAQIAGKHRRKADSSDEETAPRQPSHRSRRIMAAMQAADSPSG